MKVIAFILAAYLLLLIATPCCVFDNCPEEKIGQNINYENKDGDCSNCSPFFTCTGCAGFTLTIATINNGVISFFSDNNYAVYILSFTPEVHYDFWQPPRLAC